MEGYFWAFKSATQQDRYWGW